MQIEEALKDYLKKFDADIVNDSGYDVAVYIILQIVDFVSANQDQTCDVTELLVKYAHSDGLHVKFEKRFLDNFCTRIHSRQIGPEVYSHLSGTSSMFKNVIRTLAGDFLFLVQTEYDVEKYAVLPEEKEALKKVQVFLDSFDMFPIVGSYYIFKSVLCYVLLHKELLPNPDDLDSRTKTLLLNNFIKQIYSENYMKIAFLKSFSLVRSNLRYGTLYYNKKFGVEIDYYDLIYSFARNN